MFISTAYISINTVKKSEDKKNIIEIPYLSFGSKI
jgi:hypothetical protein